MKTLELPKETDISKTAEKIKTIGYAWWGFMSDIRMKNGQPFSSPDGSMLHAFSIAYELQKRGIRVYQLYPDRDVEYIQSFDNFRNAFSAFSTEKRYTAWANSVKPQHFISKKGDMDLVWPDVDAVIMEWRMPTRYNELPFNHPEYEPDFELQIELITYYRSKGIPIICLDLDYLMDPQKDDRWFYHVFEPGFKRGYAHHFDIPFVLEDILQFQLEKTRNEIVYIGNRYNRDAEFEKYFGEPDADIEFNVYGNWKESGRDSQSRWPHIHFYDRIQPSQMHDAYKHSLATPLLLKDEYNQHGFMSIRLIESLLFGTIPMLPIAFRSPIHYAIPRIQDEEEMLYTAKNVLSNPEYREYFRKIILSSIHQHDAKHFVNKVLSVL